MVNHFIAQTQPSKLGDPYMDVFVRPLQIRLSYTIKPVRIALARCLRCVASHAKVANANSTRQSGQGKRRRSAVQRDRVCARGTAYANTRTAISDALLSLIPPEGMAPVGHKRLQSFRHGLPLIQADPSVLPRPIFAGRVGAICLRDCAHVDLSSVATIDISGP